MIHLGLPIALRVLALARLRNRLPSTSATALPTARCSRVWLIARQRSELRLHGGGHCQYRAPVGPADSALSSSAMTRNARETVRFRSHSGEHPLRNESAERPTIADGESGSSSSGMSTRTQPWKAHIPKSGSRHTGTSGGILISWS